VTHSGEGQPGEGKTQPRFQQRETLHSI
jgi:hypothetical protein